MSYDSYGDSRGPSEGTFVGALIGGIAAFLIITPIVVNLCQRRRMKKQLACVEGQQAVLHQQRAESDIELGTNITESPEIIGVPLHSKAVR